MNKNIQAFEIWQKQTKLPDRYYLGEIQIKSLREFEKAKSNLNLEDSRGKKDEKNTTITFFFICKCLHAITGTK